MNSVSERDCLVVDDSAVVRKITSGILKNFDFSCREAEDGVIAYDKCLTKMPDLIMLDWNMPNMNGIDFLKKLRSTSGGDSPKVIFCTTENDLDHVRTAISNGADEYIMKPYDADVIKIKLLQIGIIEDS